MTALPTCHRCGQDVIAGAPICGQCGNAQSRWRFGVHRGLSILSSFTLIVGALTVLVSLLPSALTELVDMRKIELLTYQHRGNTQMGTIPLLNSGRGDAFVHSIVLVPEDRQTYPLRPITIRLNTLIKEGDGLQTRIGQPAPLGPSFAGVVPETIPGLITDNTLDQDRIDRCFRTRLLDADLDGVGLSPEADVVIGSIPLVASASLMSTRTYDRRSQALSKTLRAVVLFDQRCAQ